METHPFNLSTQLDSASDTLSAFEIDDDIRHLLFETQDALFIRPYIGLVGVDYVEIDAQIKSGLMVFNFSGGESFKISGCNLESLGTPIQKERLSALRIGMSSEEKHPRISSIERTTPNQDDPD